MAGSSKRVRYGDKDFEETVLRWFDEVESDFSDVDSISDDECINSNHESDSTLSEISDESEKEAKQNDENLKQTKCFYGKNRYRWSVTEVRPSSRTRKHNIVIKVPVLRGKAKYLGPKADPISVWQLLFTDDILLHIVKSTNCKINKMRMRYETPTSNLKDTDLIELKAFLGLLIFSSIFNSNHENIETLFATDGTGRDIFRAVMSSKRFAVLLSALRFDNFEDRAGRIKQDPTAAISYVFNSFIENCQSVYGIGQSTTIDEMLVSFRGRARFKMYMPNKPCKYGIKIMCLTDARNSYLYNAYIYCGKDSDGIGLESEFKKFSKPTQSVLRLAKPIFGSNRNVTADNWFSSIELLDILLEKKLTYVGTMKKNKREIPPNFLPNKSREVGTTLYGFRGESTIISYVTKKGKATVLISSMHDRVCTDIETQKPEIIAYYNQNKGGVDSLDEKCAKHSSSRRTRRWPLAVFFRILDVSVVNSYILHQCFKENDEIKEKSVFAKSLASSLVRDHMKRRLQIPQLPRELRFVIARILQIPAENTPQVGDLLLQKRKACFLCHRTSHRMTKYLCVQCRKPVCLQCSKPACNDCIKNAII